QCGMLDDIGEVAGVKGVTIVHRKRSAAAHGPTGPNTDALTKARENQARRCDAGGGRNGLSEIGKNDRAWMPSHEGRREEWFITPAWLAPPRGGYAGAERSCGGARVNRRGYACAASPPARACRHARRPRRKYGIADPC